MKSDNNQPAVSKSKDPAPGNDFKTFPMPEVVKNWSHSRMAYAGRSTKTTHPIWAKRAGRKETNFFLKFLTQS